VTPDRPPRRFNVGLLLFGVMLILAGTIILLERLEITRLDDLASDYWPLIIVVVGIAKLFNRATIGSAIGTIAVGLWLQFIRLDLFGLTFRNSWPAVLMAVGAGMIVQTFVDVASRGEKSEV
jgi:hypothetical protein